eukprot:CFRG0881T1
MSKRDQDSQENMADAKRIKIDKVDQASDSVLDGNVIGTAMTVNGSTGASMVIEEANKKHTASTVASPYFKNIREEAGMSEAMCGIESYTTPGEEFHCILKHRFSDFVVNEIDPEGNVVHLTSLECNFKKKQKPVPLGMDAKYSSDADPVKDIFASLKSVLTPEWVDKVREYFNASTNDDAQDVDNDLATEKTLASDVLPNTIVLPFEDDKEKRTAMHRFVKGHFMATHRTDTVQDSDKKTCVRIMKGRNRDIRRDREGLPKFVDFVLYKEARDTMSAVNIIGKMLHLKPQMFSYAGVKDKRAITTQRMRIKGRKVEDVFRANSKLQGMFIGNMEYAHKRLELGDLQGNQFTVVLRELSGVTDDEMINRVNAIKQNGFVNYYGLQRFGSRCPTHHIGMAVMKQQWEKAVALILSSLDEREQRKCQVHLEKHPGDFAGCGARLSFNCHIEKKLLHGLAKFKGDAKSAYEQLERRTRQLYVHAVQSYVWNKCASKRAEMFGHMVAVGDVVMAENKDGKKVDGEIIYKEDDNKKIGVHHVTEQDVTAGTFSMKDVVLPLPGYAVHYPKNEIGEYFKMLLDDSGMSQTDALNPAKKNSHMALAGGYRNVLVFPENMSAEIVYYEDADETITYTDYERLDGVPAPIRKAKGEASRRAGILKFDLPSSSYATMLFRELVKSESGTAAQALLTQTVRENDENLLSSTPNVGLE